MVALAHQGGWDEAALVVAPMVILAVLLWLARRRAEREVDAEGPGARPDREPEPPLR